jgi:hypothetical protein
MRERSALETSRSISIYLLLSCEESERLEMVLMREGFCSRGLVRSLLLSVDLIIFKSRLLL